MEDDNKDKIIENNIINKNNEGNDIKEPENVKEIIQDNLNNNSQKESEKEISKELKENNQALNINLKDNIFDKEFKKKEKERKKLKSVVVHMGHSEGGHYYAFIKDEKSRKWYQFNDTSVIPFNEFNLDNETFGGKEDNGENKNRSA